MVIYMWFLFLRFWSVLGIVTITLTSKNSSNESWGELNFLQKTQWKHISVYPRSEGRELQRWRCDFIRSYLKMNNIS